MIGDDAYFQAVGYLVASVRAEHPGFLNDLAERCEQPAIAEQLRSWARLAALVNP